MQACGLKVILEKVDTTQEVSYGGIVVPSHINTVTRVAKARVMSIGKEASDLDLGLKVGDAVIYDYYSVFNEHSTTTVTNIENIIAKISLEDKDVLIPLGNTVLTIKMEQKTIRSVGGILLPDSKFIDEKWLQIIGFGLKYEGMFKVGDCVKIDPKAKDSIILFHKHNKHAIIQTSDIICMLED
jgi:co-chaperonin GroES (HSP10)